MVRVRVGTTESCGPDGNSNGLRMQWGFLGIGDAGFGLGVARFYGLGLLSANAS